MARKIYHPLGRQNTSKGIYPHPPLATWNPAKNTSDFFFGQRPKYSGCRRLERLEIFIPLKKFLVKTYVPNSLCTISSSNILPSPWSKLFNIYGSCGKNCKVVKAYDTCHSVVCFRTRGKLCKFSSSKGRKNLCVSSGAADISDTLPRETLGIKPNDYLRHFL